MPDDTEAGQESTEEFHEEVPFDAPPEEEHEVPTQGEVVVSGREERLWGMACHLSGAAVITCIPFANVLAPFVVWMLKREDYSFVNTEGEEAVNFQLTMFIAMVIGYILTAIFWGFLPVLIAVVVVDVVFVLIASMKANEGESYRYPLAYRFFK